MTAEALRFEAWREVCGALETAEALRDVYGATETNSMAQWRQREWVNGQVEGMHRAIALSLVVERKTHRGRSLNRFVDSVTSEGCDSLWCSRPGCLCRLVLARRRRHSASSLRRL